MKSLVSFPRYEGYKDSGEQWIGEVPKHWKIKKLKHLFFEKKHKKNMSLNCGSISFGEVVNKDDERVPGSTKASYQEVLKGEFLINPLNMNYDLISLRIALSKINVVVSAGYIVIKKKRCLNKEYFNYLLHRYDVAYMKLLGSGVRQTINFNHISNSLLIYPSLIEQKLIATFLDQKTAQIDQAIDIKKKQIEPLKERQQVVIQQAVTKGLDPSVKMKNSGVEWIGEVPEHWDLKALKYIAHMQSGETIKPEDFKETGYPVYGGNGFRGYTNKYTNLGDHILIGRQGALCGNVNYATGKFFASEHAIVVYPYENDNHFWLGEAIRLADFNRLSQSAAQPGIAVSIIKNEFFPYPPLNEQNEISNYIIKTKKTFDIIENIYYEQIKKLQEYKASLINSAVTGKIKITPDMIAAEE